MASSKILEALEKFSERYSSDRSLFPVASAEEADSTPNSFAADVENNVQEKEYEPA
jgi:hypothetical protein